MTRAGAVRRGPHDVLLVGGGVLLDGLVLDGGTGSAAQATCRSAGRRPVPSVAAAPGRARGRRPGRAPGAGRAA